MNALPIFPPREPSEAERVRAERLFAGLLCDGRRIAEELTWMNCLLGNPANFRRLIALANGTSSELLEAAQEIQADLRARLREVAEDMAEDEENDE